jgi:hypothetical protein
MDPVPNDSFAECPLSGLFTGAAGAPGEECGLLVWELVNGLGDGVVTVVRGVSAREDPREEGVVDEEIIDPSRESDRVGINRWGRGWRFGGGMSIAGDPLCSWCVVGIPLPRGSAVAIVVMTELPGEPASPAPSFVAIERFVSSANPTC